MSERFIVVRTPTGTGDLIAEEFDDYDRALDCVKEADDKAVIVRVENICDQAVNYPTTITIEYHT